MQQLDEVRGLERQRALDALVVLDEMRFELSENRAPVALVRHGRVAVQDEIGAALARPPSPSHATQARPPVTSARGRLVV